MEKVIEYYKPDVLMFHDDWGTQNNMFFSPDVWRSLIKPQIKKAVDRCHELGVLFDMHSCGKIEAVVPEFVELGIDAWQGMEINDIPKLKSITGMNLGYHTTPDYQGYQTEALAGTLTEEDLRRRVREVFEKTRGRILLLPNVPSIRWMVHGSDDRRDHEMRQNDLQKRINTSVTDTLLFMMYKKKHVPMYNRML